MVKEEPVDDVIDRRREPVNDARDWLCRWLEVVGKVSMEGADVTRHFAAGSDACSSRV